MTWRLLICFSFVCIASASTVIGRISVVETGRDGTKPADAAGTVVWLDAMNQDSLPVKTSVGSFRILQKNKTFTPHVLAIPAGSTVEFPNSDPIFHNAFSNYDGQIFDIGLYPPGSSRSVTFRREGVVRVFCNIHASMSAVIVVLRSPFFAVSDAQGAFVIDGVPPGTYRLSVFSEHVPEKELAAKSRTVEVKSATEDLGAMTMTGSSVLHTAHLNKFGKPYPSSSENSIYPGARQ